MSLPENRRVSFLPESGLGGMGIKNRKIHARELVVDDWQGTCFGGLSRIEKAASRLSVWSFAQKQLPARRGIYVRQA